MTKKRINFKVIMSSLLLFIILFFALKITYKVVTYRNDAITYLEEKYNEEFNVPLMYKAKGPEFAVTYDWEVTSKSHPDKKFRVTRLLGKNNHFDTYQSDKFEEDICKYYEDSAKAHWNNAIIETNTHFSSSFDNVYDDYEHYLCDENVDSAINVYIKYDDSFNYDIEAEKIFNLIKAETESNHKIALYVYYLKDEIFNDLTNSDFINVSSYDCEEYYRFNVEDGKMHDISDLTKESIIKDFMDNREFVSRYR